MVARFGGRVGYEFVGIRRFVDRDGRRDLKNKEDGLQPRVRAEKGNWTFDKDEDEKQLSPS